MDAGSDIADFSRRDITLLGKTKPVLLTGATGPGVIVIHEVYGFTPTLARFCRWVRDAGFRVYAPVLFGPPMLATRRSQRWDVSYRSASPASSRCLRRTKLAR
jgi:dienelactone hydrolase